MSFQPNQSIFTCTAVNLRTAPGYLGDAPPVVLALLPERTACVVSGAATAADGLIWWPLRVVLADGQTLDGWAAESMSGQQLLAGQPPAPQPPVDPVTPVTPHAARSNRLGFYLHSTNNDLGLWDAISRVQPPVMLLHEDAANDMLLKEMRDFRAPDAFVVGRFYLTNDAQRAMLASSVSRRLGRAGHRRYITIGNRAANGAAARRDAGPIGVTTYATHMWAAVQRLCNTEV